MATAACVRAKKATAARISPAMAASAARQTYAHDGRSGDIDLMLCPVNFSLA